MGPDVLQPHRLYVSFLQSCSKYHVGFHFAHFSLFGSHIILFDHVVCLCPILCS
jgi:hypothetical protein